jgi:hypothetical protein
VILRLIQFDAPRVPCCDHKKHSFFATTMDQPILSVESAMPSITSLTIGVRKCLMGALITSVIYHCLESRCSHFDCSQDTLPVRGPEKDPRTAQPMDQALTQPPSISSNSSQSATETSSSNQVTQRSHLLPNRSERDRDAYTERVHIK